ncbi:MAG: phosphodiester glycosidase family protein [Clostridia bacterium]|nr:phosphodiester glycosidase family protein [Clostridia bacterium]
MRKRIMALCLLLAVLPFAAAAEAPVSYTYRKVQDGTSYVSDTLRYSIEVAKIDRTKVYVTRVWMQDPGRQIRKAVSPWHKHLAKPEALAAKIPEAALAINGSGYVSPLYPWIPDEYPGESEDYYFTPLGSLTILDGELLRRLDGVPYTGLTLQADGLHMHIAEDNADVLAASPTQTWAFYDKCPLILNGESILDRSWEFANDMAIRTIIAKIDEHNYVILTVTSAHGLTLPTCTDFLLSEFHPEWAFNLDGGTSGALIRRKHGKKKQVLIYGSRQMVVDVMAFTELPAQ